jgi:hypothetical protein
MSPRQTSLNKWQNLIIKTKRKILFQRGMQLLRSLMKNVSSTIRLNIMPKIVEIRLGMEILKTK